MTPIAPATPRPLGRRRPHGRRWLRRGVLLLATLLLAASGTAYGSTFALPQAAPYQQIEGSGSTWSKLIVDQWIADVRSNGMRIAYNGGGSSQGRKNFGQDVTDFAISEIPYQGTDEFGNADTSNGREFAYLPVVAGGTAFTYQLKVGDDLVRNLRLSGETLSKIFTNQITSWDDPAIARDNNGRRFPKLPITPVVRSDGSGTTAQFTAWMADEHGSIWRSLFPKGTLTSYFPVKGRAIAQSGSDRVMSTISSSSGNGTIGYVEYSYALNKDYPVVKVLNRGGYYVEPTQYNVAVALTRAKIQDTRPSAPDYLTQKLDGVYAFDDPRSYPLSSYSYMIIPVGKDDRRMTTGKRQTIVDFLYYSLCQGQTKAGPYGYSPLPLNLVQAGFTQTARLKKADPAVELTDRDVRRCNNPTFDGSNLKKNKLAEVAPMPAACDKQGAGPCGTDTGTNQPSTDDPEAGGADGTGGDGPADGGAGGAAGSADGGAGGGSGGGEGAAAGPDGAPEGAVVDPATGQVVSAANGAGDLAIFANPVELTSQRPGDAQAFAWLAVAELLALILLPGLLAVWLRQRGQRAQHTAAATPAAGAGTGELPGAGR